MYIHIYIYIYTIPWRSNGVMKNLCKTLVGKRKQKKVHVKDLDVDGLTLIWILNNQDVD